MEKLAHCLDIPKIGVMQETDTAQDYLKTIYSLANKMPTVSTSAIARRLRVSPASVTSMVKRLSSQGYLTYHRYHGVSLTDEGTALALEVIRHHRLLETYLHDSLGMPWDKVHAEAEVLEHVISEDLEDLIAGLLGEPTHDPHGDPIPPKQGPYEEVRHRPLAEMEPGYARIERVSDKDPEALRYLSTLGLIPGTDITIRQSEPFGGPLWVEVGSKRHALGRELASTIYVSERTN